MEGSVVFFMFLIVAALAVIFRLAAGGLDRDRVRAYVESRGGQVLDSSWAPFGPGWFGEKNNRIYEVRYLDKDGNEHRASCKTSMWTGVYFTQDEIIQYADRVDAKIETLADENRRLRAELDRLKHGKP